MRYAERHTAMNSFKVFSGAFDGSFSCDSFPDTLCMNDMAVVVIVVVRIGAYN